MKTLIASALAVLAGLGWFGARTTPSVERADVPCSAEDCDVSVDCRPDGTCLVECEGPDGACWAVLACDEDGECEVLESGGTPCELADCAGLGACTERNDCPERLASAKALRPASSEAPAEPACAGATGCEKATGCPRR